MPGTIIAAIRKLPQYRKTLNLVSEWRLPKMKKNEATLPFSSQIYTPYPEDLYPKTSSVLLILNYYTQLGRKFQT